MNMYEKAREALERAGFWADMVGTPDDICIYVNVWNDEMEVAHEMRLYDTEIGWWASMYEKKLVS